MFSQTGIERARRMFFHRLYRFAHAYSTPYGLETISAYSQLSQLSIIIGQHGQTSGIKSMAQFHQEN